MSHQIDESVFRGVLPEDIEWKPFPAFPPSARLAVLVGDPTEPGPYVIRVKLPAGVKLMPHVHPEDRVYTVISGVFYIGLGEHFDSAKLEAYPPGSVIVLPGGTAHFHWARSGDYVTQVTAIGPLGLEYVDPGDDPREPEPAASREIVGRLLSVNVGMPKNVDWRGKTVFTGVFKDPVVGPRRVGRAQCRGRWSRRSRRARRGAARSVRLPDGLVSVLGA